MTTLREKYADRIRARARSIYKRERAKQQRILIDHYNTPYSGTGRLIGISKGTRFAAAAWDRAKTQAAFDQLEAAGLARIQQVPDDCQTEDDLFGDVFNPDANPEVKRHVMEREKQHEIDRANNDGVWGYIAEVWTGREWQHVDSIFGFIGDDFHGSDYDTDLMQTCVDYFAGRPTCSECGQPLPHETH